MNPVTVNSSAGTSVTAPTSSSSWTASAPAAHLRTVHRRTLSMSWPMVIAPLGWRLAGRVGHRGELVAVLAGRR